ncbi:thioesterase domain-containing protein [Streptomyces sp. NPDC014991]|uniref:thioesterase II family protein n=1 Tax=Streptomyces sp. NPDC014991 TaxID=3364935 RepID=UPI003701B560
MGSEWFRDAPAGPRPGAPDPGVRPARVPRAGGAAGTRARLLAPGCEVLGVQYPGRQDRRRQAPVPEVGRLADALAREMTRHVPGRHVVVGHSMGAVVTCGTARRLHGRRAPCRLFPSGRGASADEPCVHDRLSTDAELLAAAAGSGGRAAGLLGDSEVRETVMLALRADGGGHLCLHGNDRLDAVVRIITAVPAEPARGPMHTGAGTGAGMEGVTTASSGEQWVGPGAAWR